MFRVLIMYPKTPESTFDTTYYVERHLPVVREIFADLSLVDIQVDVGLGTGMPGQDAPYASVSLFSFEKLEDFQTGMAARGNEIIADVPNYTNVQPVFQINQVLA